ncbi:dTDP-glucose 4,6-dehydratase [Burkholderiales bacterium]|nr:dTDP-glucose 4,6-dehydratase [Burkholderiales bacterium]
MTILVTGGSGFIGSNFIRNVLQLDGVSIVNIDKLTYAGNAENLSDVEGSRYYTFVKGDIGDHELINELLTKHQPRAIINFAAESHVDRSIVSPEDFIATNVVGLFRLLNASKDYWSKLDETGKAAFRFLQVSTDEVYGSLEAGDPAFSETNRFEPNSPYSASKASADHLVRAYHQTYGLPTLTTNCSNNYGSFQFPEKLIPLIILNALDGKNLPVYGDGQQTRDWLYVTDHCDAIADVLNRGVVGETYNIGGESEMTNLDVVRKVCSVLDELRPSISGESYEHLIEYVTDRPGHDRRYAVDITKVKQELGWTPKQTFESGIRKTIQWYLDNQEWVDRVRSGAYREWIIKQYG